MHKTDVILIATADRFEVYDDVMRFFWSCAKAFPILTLLPGFLLPLAILFTSPATLSYEAHGYTD